LNEEVESLSNKLNYGFKLRVMDLRILEALFNIQSLDSKQIARETSLPEKT